MKRGPDGDIREFVDIKFENGANEESMLDTGASASAMGLSKLIEHGLSDIIDKNKATEITFGNKQKFSTLGTFKTKCDVENVNSYDIEFHVVENLNPAVILGIPFLQESGVLDDFRNSVENRLRSPKN